MLLPFRAAIEAGARAVMTAHVRVAGLDDVPATLSKAAIDGLLRGELGFTGVVVTDALEMRAVSATVGVEEGAVRALEARRRALPRSRPRRGAGAGRRGRGGALGPSRRGAASRGRGRVAELGRPLGGLDAAPVGSAWTPRGALLSEGKVTLARPPLVVELEPESSIAARKREPRAR